MISANAIYVLWLRELKRFTRAKSQIIGTLTLPFLLLVSLGMGLNKATLPGITGNYLPYIVPGIIAMSLMTRSLMTGISVLWDKEFGFLKEIMIAPVSRASIIAGRIAGGLTTSLIQATLVFTISLPFGFTINNNLMIIPALITATLTAITFIGVGLIIASLMKDIQGFGIIMNLIILPLFLLSGAFYPLNNLPEAIRWIGYINPLTYCIDGLRGAFINTSMLPIHINILILTSTSILTALTSTYLFEKNENA